jgi:phosphoglycolate phosphatase
MLTEAMPIRAALFDFDGTLADSYRAITASVNHVRAHYKLAPLTPDQVRPHVGRGLPHLLKHCMPGADPELAQRLYREHHPSVLESGTVLLPGALNTLRALHERGLKVAICSNKPAPFTRTLVRTTGLSQFVDEVIGPEDVARPKPAPDMILEALKRLRLSTDEAVYVGDMTVDIQTARAAEVHVWIVATGSDTREALEAAKPDRLLDNLTQVPRLAAGEPAA